MSPWENTDMTKYRLRLENEGGELDWRDLEIDAGMQDDHDVKLSKAVVDFPTLGRLRPPIRRRHPPKDTPNMKSPPTPEFSSSSGVLCDRREALAGFTGVTLWRYAAIAVRYPTARTCSPKLRCPIAGFFCSAKRSLPINTRERLPENRIDRVRRPVAAAQRWTTPSPPLATLEGLQSHRHAGCAPAMCTQERLATDRIQ